MRYRQFEIVVFTAVSIAILANLALVGVAQPLSPEMLAQLMLLAVLACALHWGSKAGLAASIVASLSYALLQIGSSAAGGQAAGRIVVVSAVQFAAFLTVGFGGGLLFERIHRTIDGGEARELDDLMGVLDQRHILETVRSAMGLHERYGTQFSIVTLAIPMKGHMSDQATRERARAIATYLSEDLRLVDEIGRMDDGRYVLVLPSTPMEGARVVADRVKAGVCELLGCEAGLVTVGVMVAPEEVEAIAEFVEAA